ncbi:MAG: oxygen-independent coproporphyrinogen oxidase [Firmicutes bacterium]|nr:oxygen-independent coproporphyrinogen oxidase [Bacillota bacterium]
MKLGVYIHIPFCRRKCLYCDFSSSADEIERYQESYITALSREITGRGGVLSGYTVDSVYFGGGTPTVLQAEALGKILARLSDYTSIEADVEITVEANPDTVDGEKLSALRMSGVNRISFGVQSFTDEVLKAAGRIHSAEGAKSAVWQANASGFDNVSLDLMYGLPKQSAASFRSGLNEALKLPVRHLSVYGLKVEDNTPFGKMAAEGRLVLPEEEEEDAMYQDAVRILPQRGFERYEISNYALPGYESRHNLKYWRYQPYLGLGVAAHSFMHNRRAANTRSLAQYLKLTEQEVLPVVEEERVSEGQAMAEFAFLALRTKAGLRYQDFNHCFGTDFLSHYGPVVETMTAKGAVIADTKGIRLTDRGMKYGNVVFAAFLPE